MYNDICDNVFVNHSKSDNGPRCHRMDNLHPRFGTKPANHLEAPTWLQFALGWEHDQKPHLFVYDVKTRGTKRFQLEQLKCIDCIDTFCWNMWLQLFFLFKATLSRRFMRSLCSLSKPMTMGVCSSCWAKFYRGEGFPNLDDRKGCSITSEYFTCFVSPSNFVCSKNWIISQSLVALVVFVGSIWLRLLTKIP